MDTCLPIEVSTTTPLLHPSSTISFSVVTKLTVPRESSMKSNGTTRRVRAPFIISVMKLVRELVALPNDFLIDRSVGKLYSYVFGDVSCAARMEASDPKPIRYVERTRSTVEKHFCSSERRAESIIDETDLNGEAMTREVQLSPPTTPSTTMRQSHDTCSFFGRRRRHHHHHRSTTRSRRTEFGTSTSGRPVIITDETRRPMLSSSDTTPQDLHSQQQDHQIRIKHRSMKGQTYRLKLFNRQLAVPFDRLWLLTVFDRSVMGSNQKFFSTILFALL